MNKKQKVYWLDIQNNIYLDITKERKIFIARAKYLGNEVSIDQFINFINNDEINASNCVFVLE